MDDTKPYLRLAALILGGLSSVGDGDGGIVGRPGAEGLLLSALAGGVNSGTGIALNEAKDYTARQRRSTSHRVIGVEVLPTRMLSRFFDFVLLGGTAP